MYKKFDIENLNKMYFSFARKFPDATRRKDALVIIHYIGYAIPEDDEESCEYSYRKAKVFVDALLNDKEAEVRLFAAACLDPFEFCDSEEKVIKEALIQATCDEDFRVRIEAINHLWFYDEVVEPLVRALADSNLEVRLHAALNIASDLDGDCESEEFAEIVSRLSKDRKSLSD